WLERDALRQIRNQIRDSEDHSRSIRRLHNFAVQHAFDLQSLYIRDFVARRDEWTKWRKSVEALAPSPLTIAELQVARADIIDERISKDVVKRFRFTDSLCSPANDYCQFSFVIDLLADRRQDDWLLVRAQSVWQL